MNDQKVSIIMATFNRAHFIIETLLSIKNQSYLNWECLIIDDGGTDGTAEIIKPFLDSDSRFQYYKRIAKYKKGLPGCRNYGLDLAIGGYIVFFDDDDIVHPENLQTCTNELLSSKIHFCRYLRSVFIGGFKYTFDDRKEYSRFIITVRDIESIVNNTLPFNSCAVVWKKECFENNRFNETLMYAEEWELYTRIIATGKFVGVSIDKNLFYGRKHEKSNTGEFYVNNPVRRKSKIDAVLLISKNLRDNNILTKSLLRYFIQISLSFKEYDLFKRLIDGIKIKGLKKISWQLFYITLPFKLQLHKLKNKWKKKY
ncbi:glycosyltransferase involved in cell wall biosynthesis [Lutibacter sp. Hel_I_33_5]|uniref:glycosyltransferase family 2 protein n=1 Tax=Lutibacter sp. Hel_I_33_5 TaxID=1566289 RepID=UPI0011A88FAF|nr:glycosyltransferase family 2 protein [Lutibacter sp. Hel_I_33_5]TVZ54855.1 glycosyltransferase involved in cell wall biosynthesis [Lutibacter sp. Hel_I_33_5]